MNEYVSAPVNLGIILTPAQLKEHADQINKMNGVDFIKINELMKEQIKKENKILIGYLRNSLIDVEKIILDKEKEIQFFEFKINKLESNDANIIQYEKQIFDIEKEIETLKASIIKTENEIKELEIK